MFEMNWKEMHDTIEAYLIEKHGEEFLDLSKHIRCRMITEAFLDFMRAYREGQV